MLLQGFVEVCIMHPLDLIKTRLQIQTTPALAGNNVSYVIQSKYKTVMSLFYDIL